MRSSASVATFGEPAILSAARAAAYAVFLVVLGVPHVLPLAVLVVLGGFIPYIGPFLAMAAVLLVALGTVGPQATLVLLVLMLVANGIVNNFLRPIVYGRSVHLHPAIIIIAIPAGAAIAGIIGVFAAIPGHGVRRRHRRRPGRCARARHRAAAGSARRGLDRSPRPVELAGARRDRRHRGRDLRHRPGADGRHSRSCSRLIIAASVAPVARALSRRGWGSSRAAAVAVGGTFLLIIAMIVVAVIQIAGPIVDAAQAAIAGAGALKDDAGGNAGVGGVARRDLRGQPAGDDRDGSRGDRRDRGRASAVRPPRLLLPSGRIARLGEGDPAGEPTGVAWRSIGPAATRSTSWAATCSARRSSPRSAPSRSSRSC